MVFIKGRFISHRQESYTSKAGEKVVYNVLNIENAGFISEIKCDNDKLAVFLSANKVNSEVMAGVVCRNGFNNQVNFYLV